MEASEFQSARNSQLSTFQKQYDGLKAEYSSGVVNALKEQDRAKQCVLMKQVLDTNKKITGLIKSFSGTVDPGFCKANPLLKQKLQSDLEEYNKQYEDIQQGSDHLTALKNSIQTANDQTEQIKKWFPWYSVLIVLSILILVFIIVFRTTSSAFNTQPSAPILPGGQG